MTTKLSNSTALNTITTVTNTDVERLMSYYNVDGKVRCNLNTGLNIEADDDAYETFHLTTSMFWPQISYLIYGTSSLYWLLELINPELSSGCFDKVEAPNHVLYLPDAETVVLTQQY